MNKKDRREKTSLPENYFTAVYTRNTDPWGFETSDYEREKYNVTVAALPRKKYANAFEIGCSIGVLSAMLAVKCDKLLSVDVSELPLQKARLRLQAHPQVTVQKMAVPDDFPHDHFDLIVLSEVGYYWSEPDLHRVARLVLEALRPAGQLLLVHWTPVVPDYPLTGDEVHESFLKLVSSGQLKHLSGRREAKYRLDLFEKAAP